MALSCSNTMCEVKRSYKVKVIGCEVVEVSGASHVMWMWMVDVVLSSFMVNITEALRFLGSLCILLQACSSLNISH